MKASQLIKIAGHVVYVATFSANEADADETAADDADADGSAAGGTFETSEPG